MTVNISANNYKPFGTFFDGGKNSEVRVRYEKKPIFFGLLRERGPSFN